MSTTTRDAYAALAMLAALAEPTAEAGVWDYVADVARSRAYCPPARVHSWIDQAVAHVCLHTIADVAALPPEATDDQAMTVLIGNGTCPCWPGSPPTDLELRPILTDGDDVAVRVPFYCDRADCDGRPHRRWTVDHARADQRLPGWSCHVLVLSYGRGGGKTRAGAEAAHEVASVPGSALLLVGPTIRHVIDVQVLSETSGLIGTMRPDNPCEFLASSSMVVWANGSTAYLRSADAADSPRGLEVGWAWLDEAGYMPKIDALWTAVELALRVGAQPWAMVTTTPASIGTKPGRWLARNRDNAESDHPSVEYRRQSSYANYTLPASVQATMHETYDGTPLGRQEIEGEIVDLGDAVLWRLEWIDDHRVDQAPPHLRVVVAVDPTGASGGRGDECGIVVIGAAPDGHLYVLEDLSGHYAPEDWGRIVTDASARHDDAPVEMEGDYGAGLLRLAVPGVRARVNLPRAASIPRDAGGNDPSAKARRASLVVPRYSRGQVHHVGHLMRLERQMTEWSSQDRTSPDRMDALVWGLLSFEVRPSTIHSPVGLRRREIPGGQRSSVWAARPGYVSQVGRGARW